MKLVNAKGQVKYIDPKRLSYYELQGWKAEESADKIVLKPVKKAAQPKPAVDEVEEKFETEIEEEVGNIETIDKGE